MECVVRRICVRVEGPVIIPLLPGERRQIRIQTVMERVMGGIK